LQQFIIELRQRIVKPVSCNTYINALNAFCRWLHAEGHHAERLELPLLKLEKRVLQTLTDEQMTSLLSHKVNGFEDILWHRSGCDAHRVPLRSRRHHPLSRFELRSARGWAHRADCGTAGQAGSRGSLDF